MLLKLPLHRYSWYIKRGYGVYAIRNKREAKALYDFCRQQVAEMEENQQQDNPKLKIYKKTMEIFQNNFRGIGSQEELTCCDCGQCSNLYAPYDIWQYANDHANWYWN